MAIAEMKQWKCKTCGEPLDVSLAKDGVIKCATCESVFTLPKMTADQKVISFLLQGEHDLDTGKFEDAYTAYTKACELDKTEPEAYFGMALAEFKVQYLKDEVNNRLQPICHEVSDKDFEDNLNFNKAIRYATEAQRAEYERRAEEINYIKNEFYKIQKSGLKYDCFICVKVSDENGGRTEDYKIADDIYFELKGKGYKPFFSERELKDVTGADYEARILYALKSAECMLVICLNEAYLRTKWVRNEYTRFLKLINDEEKESDSIALVFDKKPVEKLPGKRGKIQGIQLGITAIDRIVSFVEAHTPEAKRRREEQAIAKDRESADLRNQLEELKRMLLNQQGNKAVAQPAPETKPETKPKPAPKPKPEKISFLPKFDCRMCGAPLDMSKAKDGVIECDYCHSPFVLPDSIADSYAERERKVKEGSERIAKQEAERKAKEFVIEKNIFNSHIILKKYKGVDTAVVIPDGVTSIGGSAFADCSGLTSITIPNSVTIIDRYAFKGCSQLIKINIPNSVTSIGDYAFEGCSELTDIFIPNDMKDIGYRAFHDCSGLTSIFIPYSVTIIGHEAFCGCDNLQTIYCRADKQPSGWHKDWNKKNDKLFGGRHKVVWGYKGE